MKWTARSNDGETTLAAARRALRGANNVLRTRYPLFLLGLPVARDEIPVFIYHEVEPVSFASELEFLRANGYRTITLDEFLSAATRKGARGDKRVLLTFDDARRSFYEVAAMGEHLGPPPLGAPIYRAAPLLSAEHCFQESPELTAACIQRVAELGREAFFNLSDWATQLHGLYQAQSRVHPELRTRLAQAGPLRARNFSWRQTAERILAVFDELVPNVATTAAPATGS
jgi:hypothetical protein